jgi:hypothetical protein
MMADMVMDQIDNTNNYMLTSFNYFLIIYKYYNLYINIKYKY